MTSIHPFWVAGVATTSNEIAQVLHPSDDSLVARHYVPSAQDIEDAIRSASTEAKSVQSTSAATRAEALMHVSRQLNERLEEVANLIVDENGKPIMWARAEALRAVATFRWAAEEVRRFSGEMQRLDTEVTTSGRMAIIRRFPYGPILGISPFNFPINLVAHKLAPAIAVGAPIIIKPAPSTPMCALLLGELLAETDLPRGAWSILPIGNELAPLLVQDQRLPVISFTGSDKVGYEIEKQVPAKRLTLELGGNAAAVVLADWNSKQDLDWAASRIATFGNYQAGQSCVSVQRVLIHDSLFAHLSEQIVKNVLSLPNGDPRDEKVVVGPLINVDAAIRVEAWIQQAVAQGAKLLCGGTRDGAFVEPAVLVDVPVNSNLMCSEVFGPVIVLAPFATTDEAFDLVNDSEFGLQAGIFTHDIQTAFKAHRELEVGGVIIGDVPSFRSDQMPYGGVKGSGSGKEGLRFAMEDLTHERVMVLSGLDL